MFVIEAATALWERIEVVVGLFFIALILAGLSGVYYSIKKKGGEK